MGTRGQSIFHRAGQRCGEGLWKIWMVMGRKILYKGLYALPVVVDKTERIWGTLDHRVPQAVDKVSAGIIPSTTFLQPEAAGI